MTDHQSNTDLLTSAETATRLGIDRGTLTRWVQGGRIAPAMKLPGKNGPALFAPAAVAALKAELEAQSEQSATT
jgi:predicted site-specific integrase-resolvase